MGVDKLKDVRTFLITVFVSLVLLYVIHQFTYPFFVSGDSMYPTFQDGDFCVGDVAIATLERGDVVVFREDGILMVKRIVAIPGDDIWASEGYIYVNGELSPYQYELISDYGVLTAPVHVPENEYFCMGDNRNHSTDSREYGTIKRERILCKASKIIFRASDFNLLGGKQS